MNAEARVTTGRLAGLRARGMDLYLGIPYAAPPVGARRWQPPAPPPPWWGVRDASHFGPAPPQPAPIGAALPLLDPGRTDEDCLTLNVWAPHGIGDRPVMVWVHGGGFTTGGTAIPSYDGRALAAEGDVVVVSINYRLGALGFAPVAGPPNLGLLDLMLALEWIQDNIAAFGGDPDSVTLFGESAGGGAILHLLGAPGAAGLFHRVIVQSGATTLRVSGEHAAYVADVFVHALAGDPTTVPPDAIVAAQERVTGSLVATLGRMPFHPAVDGEVVTEAPELAVARGDVDLLIGTAADELTIHLEPATAALTAEHLARRAARYLAFYGVVDAEAVLDAYRDGRSPRAAWAALRTDVEMWLPALELASAHAAGGGTTFMYRFDWPAAPPHDELGACHGIDIPFTFGTLDRDGWHRFVGADAGAASLSQAMRQAWTNFASTGDPSAPALGTWPRYTTTTRSTMVLDRRSQVISDPRAEARLAWAAGLGHAPSAPSATSSPAGRSPGTATGEG